VAASLLSDDSLAQAAHVGRESENGLPEHIDQDDVCTLLGLSARDQNNAVWLWTTREVQDYDDLANNNGDEIPLLVGSNTWQSAEAIRP